MTADLCVGLMSGTSADGISAALVSFKGHEFHLVGLSHHAYPPAVVEKIRMGGDLSTKDLSQLNVLIGEEFAKAALKVLKKSHTKPDDVLCIGSHGQTVYHGPSDEARNTLQIGDPAVIAERTGISVVSNFRQRDIAAGGEGAPLIPYFDEFFFGQGPVRAFQNIGGIGNVTVLGKGISKPIAFDTGPGNCLMDLAIREITQNKESYDHHGQRAKQGQIDMAAVSQMIKNDFFRKPPPRSTGPELFGKRFLEQHIGGKLQSDPNGALATLNYFTAISIQESYRSFVFGKYPVSEIVVSGGGVLNKTLMKKLECLFAPIPVKSIEAYGISPQAKEPIAFAFLGLRCLRGLANHSPGGTGAKHQRILGSITRK